MVWQNKQINEKRAFTEYKVTSPTTDFPIGFEFDEEINNLHVRLNGIPVGDLGYSVTLVNGLTVRVTPAIEYGSVRLSRETDIDENLYKFTAGAVFEARTMDEDFEQIRDAQQELRDEVEYTSSRWTLKDTILELTASTSYPEPDMVFGVYVAARRFEISNYYPHIASCLCSESVTVGIYKNNSRVGTINVSNASGTLSVVDITGGVCEFIRGDRLVLKLDGYEDTLTQIAVTLVGKFPLYDLV